MKSLQLDIYSDIGCPWCFIGARRLDAVIAELADEVEVTVRYQPYLLHPDVPAEGIDLQEMLREKYGTDPRAIFDRVEAAARDEGIPLDLDKQPRAYNTTAAHTLLRHAYDRGTQAALSDALFSAYFLDARDVTDTAVLVELATEHGFTAEEVEQLVRDEEELDLTRFEAQRAGAQGIRGVPFFVLDNRFALSGAQPAEAFREAIARALEAAEQEEVGSPA
jgi:predicted DsbA family dithiol-disulfide isomerase